MKRFIFLALFGLSTLAIAAPQASAKVHHHKRVHHAAVRTRYITRTRYRTEYIAPAAPREHGLNGNVGVGLGPIHVGANAGVGVH